MTASRKLGDLTAMGHHSDSRRPTLSWESLAYIPRQRPSEIRISPSRTRKRKAKKTASQILPRNQLFMDACFELLVAEVEEAGIDPLDVAVGLLKAASKHADKVVREHGPH
jgi:hypothetical protein